MIALIIAIFAILVAGAAGYNMGVLKGQGEPTQAPQITSDQRNQSIIGIALAILSGVSAVFAATTNAGIVSV
jgi:drug/metabolite transporter (DMT)-like permease